MRPGKCLSMGMLLSSLFMPAFAQSSINQWVEDFRAKVIKIWEPPYGYQSASITNPTVLLIVIKHSGEVASIAVKKSSSFAHADENAIQAVEKAAPFSPLPDDFVRQELAINFNFVTGTPTKEEYEQLQQSMKDAEAINKYQSEILGKKCKQNPVETAHQFLELYNKYPQESLAVQTLKAGINAGLWKEYSTFADQVLTVHPDSKILLLLKISLLYYTNQLESAKKLFETFPKLETKNDIKIYGSSYFLLKGYVFYELSGRREANYYWQRALDVAIIDRTKENIQIAMKLVELNGKITPELKKQYEELKAKKLLECTSYKLYKSEPIGKLGELYKALEAQ